MRPDGPPHARVWVGIDIGGTFSDVVALDDKGEVISAFKVLSTPDDPAEAVFAGLARLEDRLPDLADGHLPVAVFHGTTAATNALIQKRGAKTALLTTDGCRDVLELRRQARPELYRLFQQISPPLIEQRWRLEIAERVASDGSVVRPLEKNSVREAVEVLREGEIEALAICFLHAYANDEHERSVGRIIEEELPHVDLSLSSDVCPEIGEFERTSTVVVNAYVSPEVRRYLRRLRKGMRRYGVDRIHVVKSNGGLTSAANAERYPVHLIESGPAAGIVAAVELGRSKGMQDLIAFDMGGTTAKVGVIQDGRPRLAREFYADRYVEGDDAGGYAIRSPVIDLAEIGAGGGSIAWLDPAGVLKVGPQSAGSQPGPACYGRGGENPTVTDAHCALGTLYSDPSEGETPSLRPDLARAAIEAEIARPLGWTVERSAHAILEIATANMAEMVRLVTVRRGLDPRDFALVAYGGAGPLHAGDIAREVGVEKVVIPPYPGMFSALGAIMCEVKYDLVRSLLRSVDALEPEDVREAFRKLEHRAQTLLADEAVPVDPESVRYSRHLDLRHEGQLHELSIALRLDRPPSRAEIEKDFRNAYEDSYGYRLPGSPVELVNVRLEVVFRPWKHGFFPKDAQETQTPTERERTVAEADGSEARWRVLARPELVPGEEVRGPTLIEDTGSVVRVLAGQTAWRGDEGVLIIEERQ
jgi:N-methylhydantoinase A